MDIEAKSEELRFMNRDMRLGCGAGPDGGATVVCGVGGIVGGI
jgi:hypothetical protein